MLGLRGKMKKTGIFCSSIFYVHCCKSADVFCYSSHNLHQVTAELLSSHSHLLYILPHSLHCSPPTALHHLLFQLYLLLQLHSARHLLPNLLYLLMVLLHLLFSFSISLLHHLIFLLQLYSPQHLLHNLFYLFMVLLPLYLVCLPFLRPPPPLLNRLHHDHLLVHLHPPFF